MVAVNVSQLLLEGPGAVRQFDFCEPFPDPAGELHLRGPISGHAEHAQAAQDEPAPNPASPFARLAALLHDDEER